MALADLGRPDVDTWVRRFHQAETFQRQWRTNSMVMEQLYELSWRMEGIPDNIQVTMPSTARAIIDEATDHSDFDPHYLSIHTPTYGLDQDAEVRASRLRAFFRGWAIYQVSHMNDVSPFRDYIKNQYTYGKGVYKVVNDASAWPMLDIPAGTNEADAHALKEQLTKDREFAIPIVLRSVDPRALYEDPSIGQKRWAIEEYEFEAQEIMPLYERWIPKQMNVDDMAEIDLSAQVRVWDCYQIGAQDGVQGIWHQVLINEATDVGVSPMVSAAAGPGAEPTFLPGEPFPYVIKFAGLGKQSSGKYEQKARGILFGAVSLLKAEARRLTQLDSIIAAMAWPTLFVTGPRNRFNVTYGPNVVNYVPPGVTVDTVSPPIPSGPIQSALATIQSGIERATFGSVIRGDKPPQVTSASQLAILSGQARLRFGSVKIQQEGALWEVFQKVGLLAKQLDAPLTIWQTNDTDETEPSKLNLDPDDIPDRLSMHVEVLTDPAEEQDRRIQLASFLFKDGVIDMEEYRERAGIRDTAAMRRRALRDKVLFESPAIAAALGETYLLESGYDIESLTLEKAMRDMLIIRRQMDMQAQLFGEGGPGGANPAGSQPADNRAPNPLGGSPGQGVVVPSAAQATQSGEASQASVSG